MNDLIRRLRQANPVPSTAELDDPAGMALRARIDSALSPDPPPGRSAPRGMLLAAAAAAIVLVVGSAVLLFTGDEPTARPVADQPSPTPPSPASTVPTDTTATPTTEADTEFPDFSVTTFTGETWTLSEQLAFDGRPVVLALWASWCAPCHGHLRALQDIAAAYPGVQVIAVAIDDTEELARASAADVEITFPLAVDDGQVAAAYPALGLPTTYVIDAVGIKVTIEGESQAETLAEVIAEVLGLPPDELPDAPPACAGSPPARPAGGDVVAFFADCNVGQSPPYPVYRSAQGVTADLQWSLEQLVQGTTADEQANGLIVGWDAVDPADRDRMVVDVAVDAAGVATVVFTLDGEVWDPGPLASASAQLFGFLDPLYATVFADEDIAGLDVNDICWGEMGCGGGVVTREEWRGTQLAHHGLILSDSCTLTQVAQGNPTCRAAEYTVAYAATITNGTTPPELRLGPGIGYLIAADLAPGQSVDALDLTVGDQGGTTWRLVRTDSGFGFIDESRLAASG